MTISVPVIILGLLSVFLIFALFYVMRNKTEGFTVGCKGGNIFNADYYMRQYPYYGDEYFKPLSAARTNLEGVPPTPLYSSLY